MSARAAIPDPIQAGLARGWKVLDGSRLDADRSLDADVVVVGSGAGGGVTAEILALSGLSVILVEEGALLSSRDFRMREDQAYPALYQEAGARRTRDKGIAILQGRSVGGSTTVNWTSSFRTPPATLAFWQSRYGLADYDEAALAPWFETMEARLRVGDWEAAPNENNDVLRRGAASLGIPTGRIRRNVHGCWNLGYCGMGCPTNAKQSMLATTIPSALDHGATLVTRARGERFVLRGGRVGALDCTLLDGAGLAPTGRRMLLRARHFVLAGGAINSPALLLRSRAPDPSGMLGKRTFLHPTLISAAFFPQRVEGWAGAPQTVYSDHFLHTQAIDGALGYKLETPPLHPMLLATTTAGIGGEHAAFMRDFPHLQGMLALLRDGFHPDSRGGSVLLDGAGQPLLDYPLDATVRDGARRALLSMAEIQFAAGAATVRPAHERAGRYASWSEARQGIEELMRGEDALRATRIASAHVMGGCMMTGAGHPGVTAPDGRYRGLDNLSVHDGSLFPTSLGANPQLSIYAVSARLASGLAQALTGRPAARPKAA